tara:strand:+ start:324 stop:680 length:357 start_codon:yes stop_codon:yes gene_type:complete
MYKVIQLSTVVLVLTLFLSGCSSTPPVAECDNERKTVKHWVDKFEIKDLKALDDKQRLKFLRWYNNTVPITDYNPDKVYLISLNRTNMGFMFETKQCISRMGRVPWVKFMEWLGSEGA